MFAGSPQADMELLADDGFYRTFLTGLKASLGPESQAYRTAILAYVKPWADNLKNISAPVTIHHGTKDSWAPIEMGYALQKLIPADVTVLPLEGLGHYSALHAAMAEVITL